MGRLTIYISGLILLTTSCDQVDNKAANTSQTDISKTQTILPSADSLPTSLILTNRNILGEWTNCATMFGDVIMTAYACHTIEFKNDNTCVITSSKDKQVVNWIISNDLLVINLIGDQSDPSRMFTDSIYETHLTKGSIGFDLALKAKNKDLIYYLGRHDILDK